MQAERENEELMHVELPRAIRSPEHLHDLAKSLWGPGGLGALFGAKRGFVWRVRGRQLYVTRLTPGAMPSLHDEWFTGTLEAGPDGTVLVGRFAQRREFRIVSRVLRILRIAVPTLFFVTIFTAALFTTGKKRVQGLFVAPFAATVVWLILRFAPGFSLHERSPAEVAWAREEIISSFRSLQRGKAGPMIHSR